MATVKVIYENGVFKPQEPVSLPEHSEAEVVIPAAASGAGTAGNWEAIDALIGMGQAVVPNVSERHDDHLYGDPDD